MFKAFHYNIEVSDVLLLRFERRHFLEGTPNTREKVGEAFIAELDRQGIYGVSNFSLLGLYLMQQRPAGERLSVSGLGLALRSLAMYKGAGEEIQTEGVALCCVCRSGYTVGDYKEWGVFRDDNPNRALRYRVIDDGFTSSPVPYGYSYGLMVCPNCLLVGRQAAGTRFDRLIQSMDLVAMRWWEKEALYDMPLDFRRKWEKEQALLNAERKRKRNKSTATKVREAMKDEGRVLPLAWDADSVSWVPPSFVKR